MVPNTCGIGQRLQLVIVHELEFVGAANQVRAPDYFPSSSPSALM
jgi:hypothetical protein